HLRWDDPLDPALHAAASPIGSPHLIAGLGPTGERLAVASHGELAIVDVRAPADAAIVAAPALEEFKALAYEPDQGLVLALTGGRVVPASSSRGRPAGELGVHAATVLELAVLPGGRVVSAGNDRHARMTASRGRAVLATAALGSPARAVAAAGERSAVI